MRLAVMSALTFVRDRDAFLRLVKAGLRDPSKWVVAEAAWSLSDGPVIDDETSALVQSLSAHPSMHVRLAAMEALRVSTLDLHQVLEAVRAGCADENAAVRGDAVSTLGHLRVSLSNCAELAHPLLSDVSHAAPPRLPAASGGASRRR